MKAQSVKLPQARQDELFIEQLGDEQLVYDAKHHSAHRLNATAARVWRMCDGETTVAQATQLLSAELQQPLDEELVWLSIETLEKAHLLQASVKRRGAATEESRRALFQRMAIAGVALLLPVITPLTGPAEAQGESTQPLAVTLASPPGKQVKTPAIKGASDFGSGVMGESVSRAGVYGRSERWHAVEGITGSNKATGAAGVRGNAGEGIGVQGVSTSGYGISGISDTAAGVRGQSKWHGVEGHSDTTKESFAAGVKGTSNDGVGMMGQSKTGHGVWAVSNTGTALYAESLSGGRAAFFRGDVEVTGDIRLVNADCAEVFDIVDAENIHPGAVMVLSQQGGLQMSDRAYDKRVAGVVSGAGDYKPGLILDNRPTGNPRKPVALMGKVFCKVDARYGAIEIGDLLTTSDTPGHAMKASNSGKAFGSVLGKALQPWSNGEGLIPILVTLQ